MGGKEKEGKITVYKKTDDTYMLKMKTSREFYSKVQKQFGLMPFNLRSMEDEKKARMGVVECVAHKLIEPFQVLYDKEGAWWWLNLASSQLSCVVTLLLCCGRL